jgi:hypothetical protein
MLIWRKQVAAYLVFLLAVAYFAGTAMAIELTDEGAAISGLVWLDCKGDQYFTPEDGDYGIAGVPVSLSIWRSVRGVYQWVKLGDTIETDESGFYLFQGLKTVKVNYKVVVGASADTPTGDTPGGALTDLTPTWDFDEGGRLIDEVTTPHEAEVYLADYVHVEGVDFGYTGGSSEEDSNLPPPPEEDGDDGGCRPPHNCRPKPPCCTPSKPGSSCKPPKGNGGCGSCTPPSSPKPGSSCTPPKGNGGGGSCTPPSSPKPGSSCTPPKGNGGGGSCTPPSSPKPGSSCTPPKGNSGGGSCNTPSNPKPSQPASNTSSGSSKGGSSCSPAPKSQPAKSSSSCSSKSGKR